ncbi:MAG TPA: alkaline phosphatase family protein [Bryobacteraceae bacterium]|jgi:phospholipase C
MPTSIERLVVLMLENRSFDHMLGFLKRDNPIINGLMGNEWNYPVGELASNVPVSADAGDVEDLNPDPNHEFAHVTNQISSTGDPVGNPDMKGFVRDYYTACNDAGHATKIMNCFTPETLPILSTLAKQYAVCDRWFASVPGSTIPNRLFVHGASSAGSLTQDAVAAPFALHTIFESFDATTPYDFAIYTSGSSILMANRYLIQHQDKFHDYSTFVFDATNGNLPAYTFIEPAYDDDGEGLFANSQHPDFPVNRGEALIREIYYALTKSPDWKSTLLLIIYDEHGGIFDHVSPPVLIRKPAYNNLPDVEHSGTPDAFDFKRLGVRVPAVFVSPCIAPNTVLNARDYEHSSVVATVRKLFCPGSQPLNWREAQAPTFDDVLALTGSDIRSDVVALPDPVISADVDINAGADEPIPRSPTDLSVLMAGAMQFSLQQRGLAPPGDYTTLTNSTQVSAYLKKAQQISSGATGAQ